MTALPDISMPTVEAIYAAYEARQESGYRRHLGASIIGTGCERSLWFTFRWATRSKFAGPLLRLFDTGHRAEERFVADLRSVGIMVQEIDPDTGRQWEVRDETGHFGGSMDGRGVGFIEAPKAEHVLEFKTHSEKSFGDLKAKGVKIAKPLHYAQMQIYMHLKGLTRAYYLAVNKNTDELYGERVKYDAAEAEFLMAKAHRIVHAAEAPAGISKDPSWYECKMCNHHAVCHTKAQPERHCRSCLHSSPVENGKWRCALHGEIPAEFEEKGCEDHAFIPAFVDGVVTDASEENGWVEYLMKDGSTWRDGSCPF